jgi:DNA-binding transcriptional regulator YiaG
LNAASGRMRSGTGRYMTPAEIRALRDARGESQAEFGAAVAKALRRPAYHWVTVSRWERGERTPDIPWHLVAPLLDPRR